MTSAGGSFDYERVLVSRIADRIKEPRKFIQIVTGPRQTGKTTAIRQAVAKLNMPYRVASADRLASQSAEWIEAEWVQARNLAWESTSGALLIIDEVQNIDQWSSVVKALWDEDSWSNADLKVILSGSSSLLIRKGLSESLMGRYELLHSTHWSYSEMRSAFDYSFEDFLLYGGYPGAAALKGNEARWLHYVNDAIIEATLSKDVLQMEDVRKPALLRSLFYLGAQYSAQELSYRKILGQLNDKGNTTTAAHYLSLLSHAGLLCGLQKYDPKDLSVRKSSPRFLVYDTSLMSATAPSFKTLSEEPQRGHLIESAVGAYLLAQAELKHFDLLWWRDGADEVDFVVKHKAGVTAIEVKSGRIKNTHGLEVFHKRFPQSKLLVIGDRNTSVEDFLAGKVDFL